MTEKKRPTTWELIDGVEFNMDEPLPYDEEGGEASWSVSKESKYIKEFDEARAIEFAERFAKQNKNVLDAMAKK